MKRDLNAFTAESEEHVQTDGRRRVELRVAWREETARLRRWTAVEVERAFGVPARRAAYHLVLTFDANPANLQSY